MASNIAGYPVAILAATLFLLATAGTAAHANEPIMLSDILEAPLMEAVRKRGLQNPQPEGGQVQDVLIAMEDSRPITVIISNGDSDISAAKGFLVPWEALSYDRVRNNFRLRNEGRSLDVFEHFYGPVAGTLGSINGILASKLLDAEVRTKLGKKRGTVVDATVTENGKLQRLHFDQGSEIDSVAWTAIQIRRERSHEPSVPGTDAVIELKSENR